VQLCRAMKRNPALLAEIRSNYIDMTDGSNEEYSTDENDRNDYDESSYYNY
jgi:hypothetical protein